VEPILSLDVDGMLELGTLALDDAFRILEDDPPLFCWRPIIERLLAPLPEVRVVGSSDGRPFCGAAARVRFLGTLGPRFDATTPVASITVQADEIRADFAPRGCGRWLALDDDESIKLPVRTERRFVGCPPSKGVSGRAVRKRWSAWAAGRDAGRT
jgi:Swiss Army Knife RNA repair-like protein